MPFTKGQDMDQADLQKNQWTEGRTFYMAGLMILCIRFTQGWIYWGGGSRRFFYAPQKLEPSSSQWMANKLQSAMPGALLHLDMIISYLLQHFWLLYTAIIVFSLIELVSGALLIFGCLTRFAALATLFLSVSLMLIFGWEGETCLDEWTMSVSNFAMGMTLLLSGSAAYSVDSWLMRQFPSLTQKKWFSLFGSGQLRFRTLKIASLVCFIVTILFTLSTYNYYRGAIFSKYHAGPVSAVKYHITLNNGHLLATGAIEITLYVDAGDEAVPVNIISAELLNKNKEIVEKWESKDLTAIPATNIKNVYAYNRVSLGPYTIQAPVSSKAQIILPGRLKETRLTPGDYEFNIITVTGEKFGLSLSLDH